MHIEAHFLGGEEISNACHQAMALANRIGCDVHFDFNDVRCMAIVGHNAFDLIDNWRAASESKTRFKIATSHPKRTGSSATEGMT